MNTTPWQETTNYEQAELAAMTREELEQLREYCTNAYIEAEDAERALMWSARYSIVVGVIRQKGYAHVQTVSG